MMPTTPTGWCRMAARAGLSSRPTGTRFGRIQRRRWLRAWRIADSTGKISASSVSWRERWPKSAEITVADAPALVPDRAGEPCQVSAALFERGRAGAQERRALRFQDHAHLGVRRRRHGPLDKLLLQRLLHRASSYLIYYYEK